MEKLYSRTEVANLFGCSTPHIGNLVKRGELEAIKLGDRYVFLESEILDFINRNKVNNSNNKEVK